MIKGMTGFAQSDFIFQAAKGTVEIRSLNNRYFDLACHLPPGFGSFEERVKKILEQKIKRGRITVIVNFLSRPSPKITLNQPLAREYLLSLKKLQKSLNLKDKISFPELVKLPGVFTVHENHIPAATLWAKIEIALKRALEDFLKSRAKEGKCLYSDISRNIRQIQNTLRRMHKSAQLVIQAKSKLLSDEEVSSFLKSSCINEELIRLEFHLHSLQERLKSNDSVGKELDFICQELLREINTSGAKLPDKQVSSCAIKIKSDIEKIREQVQNIE